MAVDMSLDAVTERLRLMGELCDQLLKSKSGRASDLAEETEELKTDEDGDEGHNRAQ